MDEHSTAEAFLNNACWSGLHKWIFGFALHMLLSSIVCTERLQLLFTEGWIVRLAPQQCPQEVHVDTRYHTHHSSSPSFFAGSSDP